MLLTLSCRSSRTATGDQPEQMIFLEDNAAGAIIMTDCGAQQSTQIPPGSSGSDGQLTRRKQRCILRHNYVTSETRFPDGSIVTTAATDSNKKRTKTALHEKHKQTSSPPSTCKGRASCERCPPRRRRGIVEQKAGRSSGLPKESRR